MTGGVLLAEVVRSGFVESRHLGSVVVLDQTGAVRESRGDVDSPIFPRSSNKPMQAVGMVRAGLRLAEAAQLALVAASHSGEPMHISGVRGMLRAAGLDEDMLRCPADLPIGEVARTEWLRAGNGPRRIAMNCSGKHTGMLLTCLAAGWPIDDYRSPDHPLQKQLRTTVEDLAGEASTAVGVDGCGAPVFALSLRGLATAFQRIAQAPDGSSERAVADAMRQWPELVGGTGGERDDTRLMTGVPGLLAKGGAEGVLAMALPGVGAVALKVDDGARRPLPAIAVAALRRLGVTAGVLDELAEPVVLGGGAPVGSVRTVWDSSR